MGDKNGIPGAHFFDNAVNSPQQGNNTVGVDPHNVIPRHRFPVNPEGGGIVLVFVSGHYHGFIDDHRIGISAVISPGIGIPPELIGGHRNTHHFVGSSVTGLEIVQNVL